MFSTSLVVTRRKRVSYKCSRVVYFIPADEGWSWFGTGERLALSAWVMQLYWPPTSGNLSTFSLIIISLTLHLSPRFGGSSKPWQYFNQDYPGRLTVSSPPHLKFYLLVTAIFMHLLFLSIRLSNLFILL